MIPQWLDKFLENGLSPRLSIHYREYKQWRWGDIELRALPYLCDRNKIGIDVGAFWGQYAYFIRRFSRDVIVVEPNPAARELLRANFGNGLRVVPAALSEQRGGTAILRIPKRATASEIALGTLEQDRSFASYPGEDQLEVEVQTLDYLAPADTGFIKIDVEGHELAVLRGATQVLSASRPNLLIELEERHRRGTVETVCKFLGEFGYRTFFFFDGRLHPFAEFKLDVHQDPAKLKLGPNANQYSNNFIFADAATAKVLEKKFGGGLPQ